MILSNGNFFLAILPVLFLVFAFIFFLQDLEWRVAFLLSAMSLGTTVVLLTESLSLFKQITFATVTFSWLFLDILAGLILFKKAAKTGFKRIHSPLINLQFFDYAGLALILIIILTIGVIAYVSPPRLIRFDDLSHEPRNALDSKPERGGVSNKYRPANFNDAGQRICDSAIPTLDRQ